MKHETRIPPLPPEEWSGEAQEVLFRNRSGVGKDGVPNVLATLARHPRLLKAWYAFAGYVIAESKVPPRDREIAILRTGWLCQSPYEWGQHVVMGRQAGLADEEIARIRRGADAEGWTPFEAAILRAADELHDQAVLGQATWTALSERYDEQQMLDLIFTIGQYHLIAMALNSIGVELDDGLEGLEHP